MRQEDVIDRIRALIVEASVDASPENYELCHRVVTRSDPKAVACFDRITTEGELDARAFHALKEAAGPPRGQVDHASTMTLMDRQLAAILSIAKNAQTDATDYSSALDAAVANLGPLPEVGAQREMLDLLVTQTLEMARKAYALETRLEQASAELDGLRQDLARARLEGGTDALTGLPNRRAFDEQLADAILHAEGGRRSLSLAFCDIDHFKQFNDRLGHRLGDQVIRLVAGQLRTCFDAIGFPARYGGDEFAVLLPERGSADALGVMQGFSQAIATRTIRSREDGMDVGRISLSTGVVTLRRGERADAFVERADKAMYQAKSQGRNRVVCGV